MNLFATAKEKAPVTSAKKGHEEYTINEVDFHNDIIRLTAVNQQLDELDAESKMLNANIKGRAVTEYLKVYKQNKKFPETVVFRGTGVEKVAAGSFMFMAQDRYIKIDQERAEELQKEYGKAIVTEDTVYTMDSKLIEKYGKVISDLILNSKDISDDDKLKLIKAETSYAVSKGTIKEALNLKKELEQVVEDVRPVFMMRNVKIEEGNN